MHGRTLVTSAALAAAVFLLAACGSSDQTPSQAADAGSSGSALSGSVTVLAAASLQDTFTTLGKQFETAHPGVRVKLNFGASSALALQINQGAPADVFASASTKNMSQVSDAGGTAAPTNFAKNVMQIAVPPSNPGKVAALADLGRPSVKLALCQPQVPCGATAAKVFTNAKLNVRPVTLEPDVKSTLTKVELNEVDAGLVYVTDVRAAGPKVKGIDIPADLNASTEYPIATLTRARDSAAARAFTAYVLSPAGQAVLAAAGFEKP
jgi:molybdate transport system substrate-binding protein